MLKPSSPPGTIDLGDGEYLAVDDIPRPAPTPTVDPDRWWLPMGVGAGAWYVYTVHDLTGARNTGPNFPEGGYAHTGWDWNLDREPYGDVERGMPVHAIADGVIHRVAWHEVYRGCVIQVVEHAAAPLWVRYWHLAPDCLVRVREGLQVARGLRLGHVGSYERGGDHIHFDVALDPFEPTWWFTDHPDVRWIDPEPILRAHCDVQELEASMRKGGEE